MFLEETRFYPLGGLMSRKDFELIAKRLGASMASRFFADFSMTPAQSRYHAQGVANDMAVGFVFVYPRFQHDLFVSAVMVAFESELLSYEDGDGE